MAGGDRPGRSELAAACRHDGRVAGGALLKTMSFHDEKMIDQSQGSANPYLQMQIRAFLDHSDPGFDILKM